MLISWELNLSDLLLQERFTEALLRDMAKVPLPAGRIYSQTVSGRPKSEVLAMLQERHPGTQYHFIEDKMGTLEKVTTTSLKLEVAVALPLGSQSKLRIRVYWCIGVHKETWLSA